MFRRLDELKREMPDADRLVGFVGFVLAVVFLVPSWVTGMATAVLLLALVLSGLSAVRGKVAFAVSVAVIVTVDLPFFSILTEEGLELGLHGWSYIIVPYLAWAALVAFGMKRRKRKARQPRYKIPVFRYPWRRIGAVQNKSMGRSQ